MIQDLKLITPSIYQDKRGYFLESFNQKATKKHIKNNHFVQDNESRSNRGTLRASFSRTTICPGKISTCYNWRSI